MLVSEIGLDAKASTSAKRFFSFRAGRPAQRSFPVQPPYPAGTKGVRRRHSELGAWKETCSALQSAKSRY